MPFAFIAKICGQELLRVDWLQEYQGIELCAKLLFQTELIRTRRDQEFGFTVEAKVADSSFQSDELCVFVSDVAKGGPVAQKKGAPTTLLQGRM